MCQHRLDCFLHGGGRPDRDRGPRPEHLDGVLHEVAFNAIMRRRLIQLRQVLPARVALFAARHIIVSTSWAQHGSGQWLIAYCFVADSNYHESHPHHPNPTTFPPSIVHTAKNLRTVTPPFSVPSHDLSLFAVFLLSPP